MNFILILIIKLIIVIMASIIMGNGAVVAFNHMPIKWFLEEGKEPSPGLLDASRQRITSTPWKWILVALFSAISIYLILTTSIIYTISVIVVLWLLLIASISDIKYSIIPDQITMLIAVSGIGFVILHEKWTDQLYGALIGFLLLMAVFGIGRLIYHKDAVGGGDIKMFASLGLVLGVGGILMVFIISTFLSAVHFAYLIIAKRAKPGETRPMMPYIFMAFTIYVVFLWDFGIEIVI
ncbi:MAG: prepilin peptidase [Peptostreptococcaceae bacterium]|nr:prepilin peptidase [Peptostreptococcaceae bacterium]